MSTSNLTKLIDRGKELKASHYVGGNFKRRNFCEDTLELKDQMLTIMAEALEDISLEVTQKGFEEALDSKTAIEALSRVNELAGKAMEDGK